MMVPKIKNKEIFLVYVTSNYLKFQLDDADPLFLLWRLHQMFAAGKNPSQQPSPHLQALVWQCNVERPVPAPLQQKHEESSLKKITKAYSWQMLQTFSSLFYFTWGSPF